MTVQSPVSLETEVVSSKDVTSHSEWFGHDLWGEDAEQRNWKTNSSVRQQTLTLAVLSLKPETAPWKGGWKGAGDPYRPKASHSIPRSWAKEKLAWGQGSVVCKWSRAQHLRVWGWLCNWLTLWPWPEFLGLSVSVYSGTKMRGSHPRGTHLKCLEHTLHIVSTQEMLAATIVVNIR